MVTIITAVVFLTSGCTISTGEGEFSGTVVDAHWGGVIFKTCEIEFQHGQQSSSLAKFSSYYQEDCTALNSLMGKQVTIRYEHLIGMNALESDDKILSVVK
jgi:hypothetical protein